MSRSTNAVKHTHQYHRVNGLWYCSGIDGCTHYMPKNMPPPVGRLSKCWGCMGEFLLTPVNMIEDKPMCDACSEGAEIINESVRDIPIISVRNPFAETLRRAAENKRRREEQEEKEREALLDDNPEVYEPTDEN